MNAGKPRNLSYIYLHIQAYTPRKAHIIIPSIYIREDRNHGKDQGQQEYTEVRDSMGEALYSNLYMLTQTFDMTAVPNADVKNSVIPQMRNYFTAATTLNEQLVNNFGAHYQVLSDADISNIRTSFNAYDAAFRSDAPTDLAQADMATCMQTVRDLLNSRYSEGRLRATR